MPLAFMGLVLMSVMVSGQYLLTTTIEEKQSRVVEMLLSAVSPMELMTGKILGQFCVGLVVLVLYSGIGLALVSFAVSGVLDSSLVLYLFVALVHNSDRGRELAWPRLPSSDHLAIRHPERRHGVENLAPDPCLDSLCRQPSRSHR